MTFHILTCQMAHGMTFVPSVYPIILDISGSNPDRRRYLAALPSLQAFYAGVQAQQMFHFSRAQPPGRILKRLGSG